MKLLSVVCCVVGFILALPAVAELQIEVTQGADDAVNIAVVPFGWLGRGELPDEVHQVVASDLQLSGRFQALPVNQMLSLPSRSSDVYGRDWALLNTEYLVLGQIEESGADLAVTFELFDVFKGAVVFRQTIIGRDLDLRDMGHHISDAVYEKLTGVPGAFSTEILYITVVESENGRIFRLNVADADGHHVRTVLQSREPILSGTWAPDGDRIAYVSFERDSRPAIYIHDIRSRKRQQVTNFKGLNGAPAFSPDGTKLAMVLSKDGNPEIYVLDLASQPRKLRRLPVITALTRSRLGALTVSPLFLLRTVGASLRFIR